MENSYSLEKLITIFNDKVKGKWHPEGRKGNDGSAGNTLEDLLGIEENNLKLPDFGEIELKTKRKESSSLVTLLHREPKPNASIPKLLTTLGWRHKDAGTKYDESEMSFRSTTKANSYTARGLAIKLTKDVISLDFNPSKVQLESIDKTSAYTTYGDWLEDVQHRTPNYRDIFPVYWERDYIEKEFNSKLNNTLFCLCKTKSAEDGSKLFYYETAVLLVGFNPANMYKLFNEHALYVDFDARTGHNHGTKFRVDLNKLNSLFNYVQKII